VLDAVGGAQVGAHLVDRCAGGAQLRGGGGQLGVLRGDDDVEVVGGELPGQLEPDAADAPVARARLRFVMEAARPGPTPRNPLSAQRPIGSGEVHGTRR